MQELLVFRGADVGQNKKKYSHEGESCKFQTITKFVRFGSIICVLATETGLGAVLVQAQKCLFGLVFENSWYTHLPTTPTSQGLDPGTRAGARAPQLPPSVCLFQHTMTNYKPTRVHLVVPAGARTTPYERPMKEPNVKKQEHVVEKAQWTVTPFVVHHNKNVGPIKPLINRFQRRAQPAVGQGPLKMIYGRLGRPMDTLQVEQMLLRAAKDLGMPFSFAYCVTRAPARVPPRLKR